MYLEKKKNIRRKCSEIIGTRKSKERKVAQK